MESIELRPAEADDLPAIVDLWREFMDLHRDRDPFFTRSADGHEHFRDFVRTNVDSDDWLVLVAVDCGRPVGYCMATVLDYPPVLERDRHGFVQDIAVTAGHRRRGIAARLYQRAEAWFAARGVSRVELQVAAANDDSKGFWARMGFDDYLHRLAKEL